MASVTRKAEEKGGCSRFVKRMRRRKKDDRKNKGWNYDDVCDDLRYFCGAFGEW
jgi:hypothetical protein